MKKNQKMTKSQKTLKNILSTQGNMTYKNLKQHVVTRGMAFLEVINGDVPSLSSWLERNRGNLIDTTLLDKFDDWLEERLKDKNLIHPSLRLGFIGEKDEGGEVIKRKKIKSLKKKKTIKREKTNDGIFAGTKKAYTYELAKEGKEKAEIIELVKEKFPDAKDKSISIWYKKALK